MAPTCVAGPRNNRSTTARVAPSPRFSFEPQGQDLPATGPAHDPAIPTDPIDAKRAIRARIVQARRAISAETLAAGSVAIARRVLALIGPDATPTVSAFWSLEGELDTRPLLKVLAALAIPVVLPRMVGKGQPLEFRRWEWGEPLVEGPFSVLEPPEGAPLGRPDLVLTPLLAFDGQGNRLGYGGGFYDRTLRQLRSDGQPVTAVGVAFEWQASDALPAEAYDQRLDLVVTDRAVRRFSSDVRR